jgi:seryl-tRNA synthetase
MLSSIVLLIFLIDMFRYYHPGSKVAGHRGYFLTNDGVDLNHALIAYGLDFLRRRGYKKMQAPFLMNKDVMAKTAQLDQFDEELYKVTCRDHLLPSLPF